MGCRIREMDKELKQKAEKLVLNFRDEFLHGNIEELKAFSFWAIAGHPEYDGTCTPRTLGKFDGDHTKIVYAIDYLLYADKLETLVNEFSILGYPNDSSWECNFSGDTINSFRTLLGNRFLLKNTEREVIEYFGFEPTLRQKINDFFYIYQRIGNFYLLPKLSHKSINQYRGTNKWKDFFDLFIQELNKYFRNEACIDEILSSYLESGINKEFFSNFKNNEDGFYELFFLEDYKNLAYPHPKQNWLCGWKGYSEKLVSKEEYTQFVSDYIDEATKLINARSERIVNELKKILLDKHDGDIEI